MNEWKLSGHGGLSLWPDAVSGRSTAATYRSLSLPKGNLWAENFMKESKQAQIIASKENPEQSLDFLKKIG